MKTSSAISSVELPAAYPLHFSARLGQMVAGGTILLSLGALCLLWPLLATGTVPSLGECSDFAARGMGRVLDILRR